MKPETMYGQTNCWVHPDINYIAYNLACGDVFISTERAARNMSYQGFFKEEGKIDIVYKFTGKVRSIYLCVILIIFSGFLNKRFIFVGLIRISIGIPSHK